MPWRNVVFSFKIERGINVVWEIKRASAVIVSAD
jgi:hypothetical protein